MLNCIWNSTKKKNKTAKVGYIQELEKKMSDDNYEKTTIKIATFNTSFFSLAPALSISNHQQQSMALQNSLKLMDEHIPRSILKTSINCGEGTRLRRKVSINVPDNEISLSRRSSLSKSTHDTERPSVFQVSTKSICDVLREVDADLLALQEVKAEEENGMKPLSELAQALGMHYAFAESWAPEYGNAILSKWPIKKTLIQKIADDSDIRNLLKVVVDVPVLGEVHFYCTQLDHLDEELRIKQAMEIIDKQEVPHILVGTMNCLDRTEYSQERWEDISKFNEEKGKPCPKGDLMKLFNEKGYTDAKHFAGEFESVVILANGQDVQGTCKYGTRIDYILSSPNLPYKFVPGSYEVISSRSTSHHHIVKVEIQLREGSGPPFHKRTASLEKSFKLVWKIH